MYVRGRGVIVLIVPTTWKTTHDVKDLPGCGHKMKLLHHVSFVDCPGHDILMATMLNGATIMDAALLLIAVNETCIQPQVFEHLASSLTPPESSSHSLPSMPRKVTPTALNNPQQDCMASGTWFRINHGTSSIRAPVSSYIGYSARPSMH